MPRKPDSATRATSSMSAKLGVSALPAATGGKRKGRRMRTAERETRVEALPVARLAEIAAQYPDAQVTVVSRGKHRQYAALVTYTDPSQIKPRD